MDLFCSIYNSLPSTSPFVEEGLSRNFNFITSKERDSFGHLLQTSSWSRSTKGGEGWIKHLRVMIDHCLPNQEHTKRG